MSEIDKSYSNLLPPLLVLEDNEKKELLENLKKLNFIEFKNIAA